MDKPFILAVVGHTNVGKTSLLRTLARSSTFGEIANQPGTTRHTEGIRFKVEGKTLIELYDTPGLEDSLALYDFLSTIPDENLNHQCVEHYARVMAFLRGPEASGRFEQEAKVMRQLIKSQAGLYVIDVREPVLAKYRDELAILAHCGKPLLPILNFTHCPHTKITQWKTILSQLGLHIIVSFDTVSPPLDGEQKLYESLMLLVESAKPQLVGWLADIEQKRQVRYRNGLTIIAEALIDVVAVERWLTNKDEKSDIIALLQDEVRKREQQCINDLLELYHFDKEGIDADTLPLLKGRFANDLFNTEAMKQMGIHIGKNIATGAIAGAGIDLAVGGLTFGTAAAIGAIIGGLSGGVHRYGKRIVKKISGQVQLSVDDTVIAYMALRLLELQQILGKRGHANQERIKIDLPGKDKWQKGQLFSPLNVARVHSEWSLLNNEKEVKMPERREIVEQIVQGLIKKSGNNP